jgi:DNA integrity scanning protein DisA with diadenylate cyclase activity
METTSLCVATRPQDSGIAARENTVRRTMFEHICPKAEWCPREVLDSVLELAIEIAREGREGRRIGTLFTVGFVDSVMCHSRPLILDPLALAETRLPSSTNLSNQPLAVSMTLRRRSCKR